MSTYFTVPGTDNVVDMKKYRTYKETFRLFTHYKTKIFNLKQHKVNEDLLEQERLNLIKEKENFPNHLLTKVKLQIFENTTGIKI